MARRITIRKSKRNPDFYEVVGGGHNIVRTMSKAKAIEVAEARRRLRAKKKKR
jgi:hypothetical protein